MEVKKTLLATLIILLFSNCSNSPDLETGEIKTYQLIKTALSQKNNSIKSIDSRNLISRAQIDAAATPVLFVELPSGQNGTLTPYPGQGIGQTWLGADGATITLNRGLLKASRGLGDDLMGSSSSMPPWSKIKFKKQNYSRHLSHITGNNKILKRTFSCDIEKTSNKEIIEIWDIKFEVVNFEENCFNSRIFFKNTYQVDTQGIVRRSSQYHSETLNNILIERIDR